MNPNDSRGRPFNYRSLAEMMDKIPPMPVWNNYDYPRYTPPQLDSAFAQYESTQDLYRLSETALWPGIGTDSLNELPAQFNVTQVRELYEQIRQSEVARRLWPRFASLATPGIQIVSVGHPEYYKMAGGARTDMKDRAVIFSDNGFALSKEAVLHELAHVIVLDTYGYAATESRQVLGHGVEFARIYVKLLENFLDPMVARRLEDTLENGSPYFKGVRDGQP